MALKRSVKGNKIFDRNNRIEKKQAKPRRIQRSLLVELKYNCLIRGFGHY